MADFIQLDKAAKLAGKSEVTIRRLIKAGKIPFQKEKTLTGFVYVVDPAVILSYYNLPTEGHTEQAESPTEQESVRPEPSYMPKAAEPVRIAIEDSEGHASEYWQKRSDLYEDKYHSEVQKHAQTREELGTWRGRAEQAQAMVIKMLPPPETPAIPQGKVVSRTPAKKEDTVSLVALLGWVLGTIAVCAVIGVIWYLYYRANY
jgi:hypothetical protein